MTYQINYQGPYKCLGEECHFRDSCDRFDKNRSARVWIVPHWIFFPETTCLDFLNLIPIHGGAPEEGDGS